MSKVEDFDFDNYNLSNNINSINNPKEIENELIELDELGNEGQKNKEKKVIISKKKEKGIDDIFNSFNFIFIFYFIQSLISLGYFYVYYKYNIKIKDTFIFVTVEIGLFLILIILNYIIICISKPSFNNKHKKCSNYSFFVLINLYKIIFENFIYFLITLDEYHDQLDFPHFEVRAYWKIAVCFYYIILLFHPYFLKKEYLKNEFLFDKSINIFLYIFIAIFSLLIFVFLTLFTQTIEDFKDRFYYLIALFIELYLFFASIIVELIKEEETNLKVVIEDFDLKIDWRINRIDFLRSGLMLYSSIIVLIKICYDDYNCCRICRRTLNNYK